MQGLPLQLLGYVLSEFLLMPRIFLAWCRRLLSPWIARHPQTALRWCSACVTCVACFRVGIEVKAPVPPVHKPQLVNYNDDPSAHETTLPMHVFMFCSPCICRPATYSAFLRELVSQMLNRSSALRPVLSKNRWLQIWMLPFSHFFSAQWCPFGQATLSAQSNSCWRFPQSSGVP